MIYTCPMHPEVRQNHPGKCPKCGGMELVPVNGAGRLCLIAGEGNVRASGLAAIVMIQAW